MTRNLAGALRLLLVTDDRYLPEERLLAAIRTAVGAGVTAVQLRLKTVPPRRLAELARVLVQTLPVPVFVNDRPDVAVAAGAAGVHLGPGDVSPALMRSAWPDSLWLGASVGVPAECGFGAEADYWGVGPWRSTDTKADAGEPIGSDGFRAIVRLAGARPCVAVGGIRPEDVPVIVSAGGAGVAVISGILGADDVAAATRSYRRGLPG
jgi:thiamine-phosphate pyrophosphorylase